MLIVAIAPKAQRNVGDKMKRTIIFLGAAMLVLICLLSIPVRPKAVLFRSVTEQDPMEDDVVFSCQLEGAPCGEYVIHSNKLYLNTQETRGALVLNTFVSFTDWTPEKIQGFRKAHPELEQYWPDPESPSAGVKWANGNRQQEAGHVRR